MEAKKVEALLALARDQLGIKESPPDSNRVLYNTWYYGQEVSGGAYPWCMAFVQWVFHQTGVPLPARTASCSALMRAAQKKGAWVTEDFRPGDVVVYDFSGKKGAPVHCGIVERVAKTGVTAIEGNTSAGNDANGGQVQRRERASRMVVGAVRPVFEEKEDEEMTQEEFNQRFCTAMEARVRTRPTGRPCGTTTPAPTARRPGSFSSRRASCRAAGRCRTGPPTSCGRTS